MDHHHHPGKRALSLFLSLVRVHRIADDGMHASVQFGFLGWINMAGGMEATGFCPNCGGHSRSCPDQPLSFSLRLLAAWVWVRCIRVRPSG
jgi:hypothetical protein